MQKRCATFLNFLTTTIGHLCLIKRWCIVEIVKQIVIHWSLRSQRCCTFVERNITEKVSHHLNFLCAKGDTPFFGNRTPQRWLTFGCWKMKGGVEGFQVRKQLDCHTNLPTLTRIQYLPTHFKDLHTDTNLHTHTHKFRTHTHIQSPTHIWMYFFRCVERSALQP